ncbi:hypothetical protein D9Q98_001511 [Chlorella vulgaris]|uniref:Flagellar FliJ protein n=1 Tax=Chlorella vulgaris TaxID=3077 RepID=A0A9D4Z3D1_CHLVU|nr:hypothetical protein D9Q98_001511 [Chlorella vulgaris]
MFGGLFSKRAVCPSHSRLHEDPADSAPLVHQTEAESRAQQHDAHGAVLLTHAEARCEAAGAELQLKREATRDALALMNLQREKLEKWLVESQEERMRGMARDDMSTCSWRELSERSFNTLMKHATVYEAQERALSQRKAGYRECVKAEQVAEQRLHAAEQERAAARLAQAQAAGAVRIKQPVSQERKAQ